MLFKENAIRKETEIRIKYGPRYTYIFKCSYLNCDQEIHVRGDSLKRHSGKCLSHSHVKRPFESIYNSIFHDHRQIEVLLSYEEFIEFTKIKKCHYCKDIIPWTPFPTVFGKFKSMAYFLDRKDNYKGYFKENCVVCCSRCNKLRGNRFSYEEFLLLSPGLIKIQEQRNKNEKE